MVRAMTLVFVLLAVTIGSLVVVQASINSELRVMVGDAWRAALISTSVSTLSLLVITTVIQGRPWPSGEAVSAATWWMWVGGILGAIYVAASSVLVARLGSAVLFALVILGQLVTSVVMDHFGVLGLEKHDISLPRLIGVAMLLAGVVLIRWS